MRPLVFLQYAPDSGCLAEQEVGRDYLPGQTGIRARQVRVPVVGCALGLHVPDKIVQQLVVHEDLDSFCAPRYLREQLPLVTPREQERAES